MVIIGKQLSDYVRFARTGMILIVTMGLIRFFVGISGVPYELATHFVSVTILTSLLFLVYGWRTAATAFGTFQHLLPVAFALAATMYGFIVAAILTEAVTGLPGYYHVHSLHALGQNSLVQNMNIDTTLNVSTHITGQLLAMVFFTFYGWGLASLAFLASSRVGRASRTVA